MKVADPNFLIPKVRLADSDNSPLPSVRYETLEQYIAPLTVAAVCSTTKDTRPKRLLDNAPQFAAIANYPNTAGLRTEICLGYDGKLGVISECHRLIAVVEDPRLWVWKARSSKPIVHS